MDRSCACGDALQIKTVEMKIRIQTLYARLAAGCQCYEELFVLTVAARKGLWDSYSCQLDVNFRCVFFVLHILSKHTHTSVL